LGKCQATTTIPRIDELLTGYDFVLRLGALVPMLLQVKRAAEKIMLPHPTCCLKVRVNIEN
jgi:hypothetical protein